MLTTEYLYGIDQFATSEPQGGQFLGDPGKSLVDHLMTALRYDLVGFGDQAGLLDRFYEVAGLERRAEAIESVGRGATLGAIEETRSSGRCARFEPGQATS
jgi:hypothetical protein